MKRSVLFLLIAIVALATASCGTGCCPSQNKAWKAVIKQYSPVDSCSALVLVKYIDGSDATVEYFVRDKKGRLTFDSANDGFVGKNGIGKEKEGDMRTPIGEFQLTKAFGILENPGTEMEYIDVKPTTWACGCSEYYNLIIDSEQTGHVCEDGEEMYSYVPAYNYGMVLSYNPQRIVGLGCNIFFHCKGKNPYTAGCVAVDEEFIKHVLQTCGTKPVISIH